MPQTDGLTFLSKMKETDPNLKSVTISAYENMDDIHAVMN